MHITGEMFKNRTCQSLMLLNILTSSLFPLDYVVGFGAIHEYDLLEAAFAYIET